MSPLLVTRGRKLRMLQTHDPYKQWWSLDETRFCTCCEQLFIARDIRILEDELMQLHFRCPTLGCPAGFADWQYPQLHL